MSGRKKWPPPGVKRSETVEEFQCNDCGERWIHGGDNQCPFCGSNNTGPFEETDVSKGGNG